MVLANETSSLSRERRYKLTSATAIRGAYHDNSLVFFPFFFLQRTETKLRNLPSQGRASLSQLVTSSIFFRLDFVRDIEITYHPQLVFLIRLCMAFRCGQNVQISKCYSKSQK